MADDPELAQWRAQRLAQMRSAAGGAQAPSAEELEMRRKQEEYVHDYLVTHRIARCPTPYLRHVN